MGSSPADRKPNKNRVFERRSRRTFTRWIFIRIILLLLLAASIGLLVWGWKPAPRRSQGFTLAAESFPELAGQAYRLELDVPARLRLGEAGFVVLRLEPLPGEPVGPAAGGPPAGGDHRVLEARLELADLSPVDRQTVETPLLPGQAAEVSWRIQGYQAGLFEGTAWPYLDTVPAAGGERQQEPVGAQGIKIEVVSILGLGQLAALVIGGTGVGTNIAGLIWSGLKKGHLD